MSAEAGRVWGGLTTQERESRRREQFLAAGLEVFGRHGWAGSTVLQVCREAKLSQRYFYEQFTSREALFLAVMERVAADVEEVLRREATAPDRTPHERVRGTLRGLADYFADDPRTVRVALVESFATAEFRAGRAALLAAFTALASRLMLSLSALMLSGGIAEALVAALSGPPPAETDELVAHLTQLYTAAVALAEGDA
jgi:AcrR family transcriptional regulator